MSKQGVIKVANALSNLQTVRGELIGSAVKAKNSATGKAKKVNLQDIRLGQLLYDASEAIKDRFIKETLNIEE